MVIKRDGAAAAIVTAAGIGKRMGADVPKQYLELNGKPLFVLSLEGFELSEVIEEIILVVPRDEIESCSQQVTKWQISKIKNIVAGGKERYNSVANGLAAVSDHIEIVAVHDGVRPLVTPGLISRVYKAACKHDAAIPALPVVDTIKAGEDSWVQQTVDRSRLWRVQTPQCFKKSLLEKAYAFQKENELTVTDDASLVEQLGQKVYMVAGEERNIKITTPGDLLMADYFLKIKSR